MWILPQPTNLAATDLLQLFCNKKKKKEVIMMILKMELNKSCRLTLKIKKMEWTNG